MTPLERLAKQIAEKKGEIPAKPTKTPKIVPKPVKEAVPEKTIVYLPEPVPRILAPDTREALERLKKWKCIKKDAEIAKALDSILE